MFELTQEQKMFQDLKRFGVDNWDGIADLLEEAAQKIENLEKDQKMLRALERAGVDNWDGYDIAMEYLEEEN